MTAPKIATCCYCGTRAVLTLRGTERHELACASCGAPLHDMKMLRADHGGRPNRVPPSRVRGPTIERARKTRRKTMKKNRKSPLRHLLEEVADVLDDIFD